MYMQYSHVDVPKSFAERFHHIQSFFGYRNFSEFVVETVRQRLAEMENIHEIKSMEKSEKLELP